MYHVCKSSVIVCHEILNQFPRRPRDRLLAGLGLAQEDAELLHHGHGPLQRLLARLLHQVQPEENICIQDQKYLLATTWTRTMQTTWRTLSPGIIQQQCTIKLWKKLFFCSLRLFLKLLQFQEDFGR